MGTPPPHDPHVAAPGGGSTLLAAAVLVAALALGGLLRHQAAHPYVAPAPSASARAARPLALPALAGPAQVTLTGGALVLAPIGATTSRPVVLVWGGAETPVAEPCALVARAAAASRPFVVCPPTLALTPGAPSSAALQPLRAALAELRARFGLHVAPGAVVVVGFGAGARDAVGAMRSSPQFFSRLGLVHGGHESWVGGIPTHFGRGGRRVLFVCPRERCAAAAEAAEARTRATLALPRVELLPGDPAPLGAETEAALRKHWAWLSAE